ncbi:MAG: SPOR domain-containing protein [Polyangiales bacterium]
MDSAMRDMERLRERDDSATQRLGMWFVAALSTAALVFSVGVLLNRATGTEAEKKNTDPLAALDRAARGEGIDPDAVGLEMAAAAKADPTRPAPTIEPTDLTFPDTLADYDARPEVEAALAAAAAELAHPDPIAESPAMPAPAAVATSPAIAEPAPVMEIEPEVAPEPLPAAVAATPRAHPTPAQALRDPLMASATQASSTGRAPAGADGAYTLQVASYQDPTEANSFADALRARGHRAFVMRAEIPGRGIYHRVRVGPFETVKAAEEYRAAFESTERMNTFVVRNH